MAGVAVKLTDLDSFRKQWDEGWTSDEIAAFHGVSRATVNYRARILGLPSRRRYAATDSPTNLEHFGTWVKQGHIMVFQEKEAG